jgi:hypothetical protein
VVWRGAAGDPPAETRNYQRLRPIFHALAAARLEAEPVVFSDTGDDLPDRLLPFDGVLVWVDPISEGENRRALNDVLRDIAARGRWVSAHPDTIDKMGTKEVLYRTKHLGWGTDTRLYRSDESFRSDFPESLAKRGPRVLKQNRGNGGLGVWKVERVDDLTEAATTDQPGVVLVRVQHAAPRDNTTELMTLAEFMDRCGVYFADGGKVVDQPYVSSVAEGMIRAYIVERRVVGFARQRPPEAADRVLGLPSAKTMYTAATVEFASLRARLQDEWIPGLCAAVGVDDDELPVLWDADFLYRPRTDPAEDNFILCEINASSVIPFPDDAPRALAAAVVQRLSARS